ncbi:hypothetical protein PGTUg99_027154 [Puccinia graminis f. sp. tritici]|uniref:Uncharacterized protein n=1 Tax=Puccinia graminis f. sp. tritici TaxID=56615 RepID=A0A5B0R8S8_PUCGR|nr:hypothetical protein PGTUg99_027154 [Puccinia graminis f. sp. tritici]
MIHSSRGFRVFWRPPLAPARDPVSGKLPGRTPDSEYAEADSSDQLGNIDHQPTKMTTQSSSSSNQEIITDRIVIPLATDERCWFKCRQSNAGRLRGQEPMCSLFCYYSNQLPSLITDPATALKKARTSTSSTSNVPSNHQDKNHVLSDKKEEPEDRWDELIRKYTFSYFEGKYFYFATGKPAVIRHLASMRQLGSVEHDWLVQKFKEEDEAIHEKSKPAGKQIPDKSHRGLVVLAYHKDYESVINIAHSIASGLASVHAHFERIYGPSYKILSKLPGSMRQLMDPEESKVPSQFTMIHGLFTQPLLSNSTTLLNRSFESLSEVLGRLATKYASRFDDDKKDNSNGRFGGRPGPPPSPPST